MLCLIVNALREKQGKDDFNSWPRIQQFVNANVNKFTQEVLNMKLKVLENSNVCSMD